MDALSLVPGDDIGYSNLVHAREEGERCEDEGRDDELILVEGLQKALLLCLGL